MHACSTRKVLVVWCLRSTENGKGCWLWRGLVCVVAKGRSSQIEISLHDLSFDDDIKQI
jgi:hypothetical protein